MAREVASSKRKFAATMLDTDGVSARRASVLWPKGVSHARAATARGPRGSKNSKNWFSRFWFGSGSVLIQNLCKCKNVMCKFCRELARQGAKGVFQHCRFAANESTCSL